MYKAVLYLLMFSLPLYGLDVREYMKTHQKEIRMGVTVAVAALMYLSLPPCAYLSYKQYEKNQMVTLLKSHGIEPTSHDYKKMTDLAYIAKRNGLPGLKLQFKCKCDVDLFRRFCKESPGIIESLAALAEVSSTEISSLRNNVILFDPNSSASASDESEHSDTELEEKKT